MNEIIKKENVLIENMIYEIKGIQVMLSYNITKFYQVETRRINEVIKKILVDFPNHFAFN